MKKMEGCLKEKKKVFYRKIVILITVIFFLIFFKNCYLLFSISGIVLDNKDNKPIRDAIIKVETDSENITFYEMLYSNNEGKFYSPDYLLIKKHFTLQVHVIGYRFVKKDGKTYYFEKTKNADEYDENMNSIYRKSLHTGLDGHQAEEAEWFSMNEKKIFVEKYPNHPEAPKIKKEIESYFDYTESF